MLVSSLNGKVNDNLVELRRIPFSDNWPSWVIRMGSQYENGKIEKISGQKWLIRLQMVQFEGSWH